MIMGMIHAYKIIEKTKESDEEYSLNEVDFPYLIEMQRRDIEKPDLLPKQDNGVIETTPILSNDEGNLGNLQFKICPECSNRTLKMEAGCDVCVDSDCGYSNCDK